MTTYTVSEFTDLLKESIKEGIPNFITIKGQLTNVKPSHDNIYCSIQDKDASLRVVIWKDVYTKQKIPLKEGDEVTCSGMITLYPKSGQYQLTVKSYKKIGMGDFYEKYLQLKTKLEQQDYFSQKRQLPYIIKNVGIITSNQGSVLQDILSVFHNKLGCNVYVKNTVMQGENCAKDVCKSINFFNNYKDVKMDVIIIARGGGSALELSPFNSEEVAMEIFNSNIVTVSAVGHETDVSISDFVADFRAPTPSLAATMILKQFKIPFEAITVFENSKIKENILYKLNVLKERVSKIKDNLIDPKLILTQYEKDVVAYDLALKKNVNNTLQEYKLRIKNIKDKLQLLNPNKILENGYSLLFASDNTPITDFNTLNKYKGILSIKLNGGTIKIQL